MGRPLHSNRADYVPKHATSITESGCFSVQEYGSIQIDLCDMLLRIHNGCAAGGVALVPLVPNCENPEALISPRVPDPAVLPADVGAEIIINHERGYEPLVQIFDDQGMVVQPVEVQHMSKNQVRIVTETPLPGASVVLR